MRIQIIKSIKNSREPDQALISSVLQENEKRANRLSVWLFIANLLVIALSLLLNELGIFKLKSSLNYSFYAIVELICLIPLLSRFIGRLPEHLLKWINLVCIVFSTAWMHFYLNYNVTLLMAAPIVMAVAYFSMKTTVITYVTTVITFACSTYFGSLGNALLDLNHVALPDNMLLVIHGDLKPTVLESGFRDAHYIRSMMVTSFLPMLLASVLLLVLAFFITKFGYEMLIRQAKQTADSASVNAELKLAGALQLNALPSVSEINGKHNFEIAASMTPAKEAGGDFYDFTMIDDTHLALVIADVCGKGVSSAMFMMATKEKLRAAFTPGRSPGEILYAVNNSLWANNKGMFVTIWLGIMDISTGTLISANAGHEDPVFKKAAGSFAVSGEAHGLAAGVRKNRSYPEHVLQFEPGDMLVQFTDGISEARSESDEMYGTQRLLDGLNREFAGKPFDTETVNRGILSDLAGFVGHAEQADDITTLVFQYL